MAQTGYTPIQLYQSSTTANVPTSGSLLPGELAINTADGKLFYKDSGGTVQVIASKSSGLIGGANTYVQYNNANALAGSANLTFNGTTLGVTGNITATNVYANSGTIGASLLTGTITTNAQPNITSVGTLSSLAVTGNITSGNLSYTGTLTGGTGIVNLGSGQFYKDASGNVGIGTSSPSQRLTISDTGAGLNRDLAVRNGDATNFHQLAVGYNAGALSSGVPANSLFMLAEPGGGYGAVGGLSMGTIGAAPIISITNGAERMRIDSSGNVGIGGTPFDKLDVYGGTTIRGPTSVYSTTVNQTFTGNVYGAYNITNGTVQYALATNTNLAELRVVSNHPLAIYTNNTERMRIDASGIVGINATINTNLGAKLQLATYEGISAWTIFTNLGYYSVGGVNNWRYPNGTVVGRSASMIGAGGTSGQALNFYVAPPCTGAVDSVASPVTAMTILDTGNVGILNTTPSYPLHVNGTGLVAGLIINGGGTYTAGSIYSDASWGMLFRAKQASPSQADFAWTNSANTERMRIDSSGNVGIGTSSPATALHVKSGSGLGNLRLETTGALTSSSVYNYTSFYDTSGQAAYVGFGGVANSFDFVNALASGFLTFKTGGYNERMRIDSSGNVGIGVTPVASSKLQVAAAANINIAVANATTILGAVTLEAINNTRSVNIPMEFRATKFDFTGPTSSVSIDTSGNVGIGTTSPGGKLDVLGAASANLVAKIKTIHTGSYGALHISNLNTNGEASIGYRDDSDTDATSWVVGKSVNATDAFGWYYGGQKMTLDTSGNVGIGTSSPGGKLTVLAGDSATAVNQVIFSGGRSLGASVVGSAGAMLFTNSYWTSGYGAALISGLDNGSSGGGLTFGTTTNGGGTTGTPTERMRIDSSGVVSVNNILTVPTATRTNIGWNTNQIFNVQGTVNNTTLTSGALMNPYLAPLTQIVQVVGASEVNSPTALYSSIETDYPKTTIAATSTVNGQTYTISTVGTTNFVAIGAASNTVGVVFVATGAGSGTGTVTRTVGEILVGLSVRAKTATPSGTSSERQRDAWGINVSVSQEGTTAALPAGDVCGIEVDMVNLTNDSPTSYLDAGHSYGYWAQADSAFGKRNGTAYLATSVGAAGTGWVNGIYIESDISNYVAYLKTTKDAAGANGLRVETQWATTGTNIIEAVVAGTTKFKVEGNYGGANNGVWLYVNGALKEVQVGAADSGGTGYRMLRVTN